MSSEPDPADLYPEIAAQGSLAAALQAAAAEQGMALTMSATEGDRLRHAAIASVASHRKAMYVTAWRVERRWTVWGPAADGRLMICGSTDDLGQLPQVVLGWANGAALGEIARAASFDVLTGRFEVPDGNPAGLIASEWQWMLKDARDAGWPEYLSMVNAAHAEPRLRRLFPYASHWALSFAESPGYPLTPSFVSIMAPRGDGGYVVREWWNGPVLHEAATAGEAISIAVGRIPPRGETSGLPSASQERVDG